MRSLSRVLTNGLLTSCFLLEFTGCGNGTSQPVNSDPGDAHQTQSETSHESMNPARNASHDRTGQEFKTASLDLSTRNGSLNGIDGTKRKSLSVSPNSEESMILIVPDQETLDKSKIDLTLAPTENSDVSNTSGLPTIIEPVNAEVTKTVDNNAADNTPVEDAFDLLLHAQRHGDGAAWEKAYKQVIETGTDLYPKLIKVMKKGKQEERELAAMMLPGLGTYPEQYEKDLLEVLSDSSEVVQANVASLLSQGEQHAETVIPVLRKLVKSASDELKVQSIVTLGNFGPVAKSAMPELLPLLQTSNQNLLKAVINTLGNLESEAAQALPELLQLQEKVSADLKIDLAASIEKIKGTDRP